MKILVTLFLILAGCVDSENQTGKEESSFTVSKESQSLAEYFDHLRYDEESLIVIDKTLKFENPISEGSIRDFKCINSVILFTNKTFKEITLNFEKLVIDNCEFRFDPGKEIKTWGIQNAVNSISLTINAKRVQKLHPESDPVLKINLKGQDAYHIDGGICQKNADDIINPLELKRSSEVTDHLVNFLYDGYVWPGKGGDFRLNYLQLQDDIEVKVDLSPGALSTVYNNYYWSYPRDGCMISPTINQVSDNPLSEEVLDYFDDINKGVGESKYCVQSLKCELARVSFKDNPYVAVTEIDEFFRYVEETHYQYRIPGSACLSKTIDTKSACNEEALGGKYESLIPRSLDFQINYEGGVK